ncbi:MAG: CocE/NonD family hydrolase [Verrucomicrobia bacterium]|nr:CocE/NonD family hydrolase [Verrucomicrobiota bacterium]
MAVPDPDFIFEQKVMIPMRDGVRLSANIFRPRGEGRHPVILLRSPYGIPDAKWGDARRYVPRGYAMVAQDCRGRGGSEGTWDPFRHDPDDGRDTQDWIGKKEWCNGSIGTSGGSYVGWTQWASAADPSPYLKAMVPVVPFAEVYDDIVFPGGAFQLALAMGWGSSVAGIILPPDKLQKAYRHLPLKTFGDQFEKKVPYLNEWGRHGAYAGYWEQRGIRRNYSRVSVPALNIGGWYDIFSKATVDMTDRVRDTSHDRHGRRNQCVIMGPWAHGVGVRKVGELDFGEAASALKIGELQFQWFEYWLRGQETGVQDWPAFQLFVMGENLWRAENEWPLKRTVFTRYYLGGKNANSRSGGGTLSTQGSQEPANDRFSYDPENPVPSHGGNNLVGASAGPMDQSSVEDREDVLVYTTEVLEEDVEVTGPIKLILHAASSARDTDFTGKLVDVHPDGKAFNLCEGIQRARWRKGFDKERFLEPGVVEEYEVDLWVTSNLFKKGHRIRLEVSSSNFPRFDRNANSGKPFGEDEQLFKAEQTIHHGGSRASHLLLPVIPRKG